VEALHIILNEKLPKLATHVPEVVKSQNLLSSPSWSVAVTTRLTATEELGDERILVSKEKRVDSKAIDASSVKSISPVFFQRAVTQIRLWVFDRGGSALRWRRAVLI
jgi:hypothetical protein